MFQYAFGRALADDLGENLFLDLTTLRDKKIREGFTYRKFELQQFPVRAALADQNLLNSIIAYPNNRLESFLLGFLKYLGSITHLHERKFSYDEDILKSLRGNIFAIGFWQSEKYFAKWANQIRSDLKMKAPEDEQNLKYLVRIQNTNAVSIHVRRGDYVENSTHPLCKIGYYEDAIAIIREKVPEPMFFIFSDDTDWVHANLSINDNCCIIEHNKQNGTADMYLMSQCKHHIIANSSFSWWGAWLNESSDKIVIAPQKWFYNTSIDTNDLIPERWISI